MNSDELSIKLSHFPEVKKHFEGIFCADNLPKKIKKNCFIICNTDIRSGAGKHWYCVIKFGNNILWLILLATNLKRISDINFFSILKYSIKLSSKPFLVYVNSLSIFVGVSLIYESWIKSHIM